MAAFDDTLEDSHRLGWHILSRGGVSLYFRRAVLRGDMAWLTAEHHDVTEFDAATWLSVGAMHDDLSRRLASPAYYGRNFHALRDCLENDLAVPDRGGRALVFVHYDAFVRGAGADPPDPPGQGAAGGVMDHVVGASRHFPLTGRRLLALAQSDDPHLRFGPLGGMHADWNEKEWLNANRVERQTTGNTPP